MPSPIISGTKDSTSWPKVVTCNYTTFAQFDLMCAWLDDHLLHSEYDYSMHLNFSPIHKYYTFYIKDADMAMMFKLTWV